MSTSETLVRGEICRIGKLLYDRGMIAGTEGNISVRLPSGEILITPSGKCKGMLRPEELVKLGKSGRVRRQGGKPSSEYRLHLYGYQSRTDFKAAVHVHSPYVTAFATASRDIPGDLLPEFPLTFGTLPLVPFARPGGWQLARSIAPWLQDCHTFLLERHGLIAFGSDLDQAFFRADTAEHCARILWLSQQLTKPETPTPDKGAGE